MSKLQKKLLIVLVSLLIICPLGLIVPELLHSGDAWGEWDNKAIKAKTGYIPQGMQKDAELWKAPLKDYTTGEEISLLKKSFHYLLSGIIGVAFVVLITYGLTRIIRRNEKTS